MKVVGVSEGSFCPIPITDFNYGCQSGHIFLEAKLLLIYGLKIGVLPMLWMNVLFIQVDLDRLQLMFGQHS